MKKKFLIICSFISILIAFILFSIEGKNTFARGLVMILIASFPICLCTRKHIASKYLFESEQKNTAIYLLIFLIPFCYLTINNEKLLLSLTETGYMVFFLVLITLYNFIPNKYKKFKNLYFILVYLSCYPLFYLLHICFPTNFFSGEDFFFILFLQIIFHIVLCSFFCLMDIICFSVFELYKKR